jgi:hypothetical protein
MADSRWVLRVAQWLRLLSSSHLFAICRGVWIAQLRAPRWGAASLRWRWRIHVVFVHPRLPRRGCRVTERYQQRRRHDGPRDHCCAHLHTGRRPTLYKHDAQASGSDYALARPPRTHSLTRRACLSSLWLAAKMCTAVALGTHKTTPVGGQADRGKRQTTAIMAAPAQRIGNGSGCLGRRPPSPGANGRRPGKKRATGEFSEEDARRLMGCPMRSALVADPEGRRRQHRRGEATRPTTDRALARLVIRASRDQRIGGHERKARN